jgi:transposase
MDRKKVKQTKERNLLDRLCDYEDQVLLFMREKNVPFTNNQAEHDIRMIKVHQKVSGQFKTLVSARHFCRIRSYLMTSKKKGYSPFDKLCELFHVEE